MGAFFIRELFPGEPSAVSLPFFFSKGLPGRSSKLTPLEVDKVAEGEEDWSS